MDTPNTQNTSNVAANHNSYKQSQEQRYAEINRALSDMTDRMRFHNQTINKLTDSIIENLTNLNHKSLQQQQLSVTETPAKSCVCTICMTNQRDCVLEPCMHVCCCLTCLKLLTDNKCPVCRTPIDFYLKLFIP